MSLSFTFSSRNIRTPMQQHMQLYVLPGNQSAVQVLFQWYGYSRFWHKSAVFSAQQQQQQQQMTVGTDGSHVGESDLRVEVDARINGPVVQIDTLKQAPVLNQTLRQVVHVNADCGDLTVGANYQFWDFIIIPESFVRLTYHLSFRDRFPSPIKFGVIVSDSKFNQWKKTAQNKYFSLIEDAVLEKEVSLDIVFKSKSLPNTNDRVIELERQHKVYFVFMYTKSDHDRVSLCEAKFVLNNPMYESSVKHRCLLGSSSSCATHLKDIVLISATNPNTDGSSVASRIDIMYTYMPRYGIVVPLFVLPTLVIIIVDVLVAVVYIRRKWKQIGAYVGYTTPPSHQHHDSQHIQKSEEDQYLL